MSVVIPSLRAAIAVPPWVKNDLWRRAQVLPSLDLRFADNKSLVDAVSGASLITFNRASNGTFVDSAGVIQTAGTDVPRFDHNPITGESLGLLVEEQRTNLLLRSEEFGTTWTPSRASVTANSIVAPDGTLTGDKLLEDTTASNTHLIDAIGVTVVSGTTYAASIYLKAAERTRARVVYLASDSGVLADVNLSAGTIDAATSFSSAIAVSSSIQSVGNGWYRCTVVGSQTAGTSGDFRVELLDASGNRSYTGDGTSGLYLWGAQLEVGAFPTSYIPTTTSAVTRSGDVASITGSAFSGWYRQDEGAMFSSSQQAQNYTTGFPVSVSINDSVGDTNAFEHIWNNSTSTLSSNVYAANVVQAVIGTSGLTRTAIARAALAYRADNFAACINASTVGTDTSGAIPVVDRLTIGARPGNILVHNGHIRRLTYWPQRLSNEVLQRITQ